MKRFFGSKQRKRDSGQQQKKTLLGCPGLAPEAINTFISVEDTPTQLRHSAIRKSSSTRLSSRCGKGQQQRQNVGSGDGPPSPLSLSPRILRSGTEPIDKQDTGSPKLPSNAKSPPPSILHKNTQVRCETAIAPPSSPPTSSPMIHFNPTPPKLMASNARVRFLPSSCESVDSSAASGVHLMAGYPNSVASSSAMSSSEIEGNHQNVFDRVLHHVMKEENVRLNAMGMQSSRGSEEVAPTHDIHAAVDASTAFGSKFTHVDAAARQALASVPNSTSESSDEARGHRVPPHRQNLLSPTGTNTGLKVRTNNLAFIDVDAGMELSDTSTIAECQCKRNAGEGNLNEDEMNQPQWKGLNATALQKDIDGGMGRLEVADSRQSRSFNCSGPLQLAPVPLSDNYHCSPNSNPDIYLPSRPTLSNASLRPKQPLNTSGSANTMDKIFESEDWVSFEENQEMRASF